MYLNKIKLFFLISICLIFFFLTYNDVKSEEVKLISGIAKIIDGDTIRINKKKIRLYGIDAPEKKQKCSKPWLTISFLSLSKDYDCGEISTDKLKNKINGKFIMCKWTIKDRY
jgi:endonuclease YncB( thermonuclease family)